MLKVKLYKTGEIVSVTRNVAHGIIERGEGEVYKHRMMTPEVREAPSWTPKKRVRRYHTK